MLPSTETVKKQLNKIQDIMKSFIIDDVVTILSRKTFKTIDKHKKKRKDRRD